MDKRKESSRTLARIMADFAFSLAYDSIPAKVKSAARRHLADSMACACGAYNTAAARKCGDMPPKRPAVRRQQLLAQLKRFQWKRPH